MVEATLRDLIANTQRGQLRAHGAPDDVGATIWDLGGVYLTDSVQQHKWVGLLRRIRPTSRMPEETALSWRSMIMGWHPWDGIPVAITGGRTEINAMMTGKETAAGWIRVGYTMTLASEGTPPAREMKNEFSALERGFMIE